MADPNPQRAFALEIVEKLLAAGFEALWAGGCVRDHLLGLTPKDYDVATSATPDEIRNVFGRGRTLPIGAAFGVVTVLGPRAAGQIEVATFRSDAAYSDGRHPDAVTFTTAERDAQRRDFTINGLFYDPIAQKVVDYVSGQEDLERSIIRAIGDPQLRLGEDKLRMLRAVRFAATFEFEIEASTFQAIRDAAADITTVSPERIGMEIRRMLLDRNRARAIELLRDSGLLSYVLPEVADTSSQQFNDVTRILAALQEPTLALALAALLSNEQGARSRDSIDSLLAPRTSLLADNAGRRLRYTNKEIDRAAWLLQHLPIIAQAERIRWPQLQRVLTHQGAKELLALHEAIAGPTDSGLAFCRERMNWPPERLNPPPLLDGSDLIRHGLQPGPQFSSLLEKVRDAQLEGHISSHDEALALVDRLRDAHDTVG